MMKHFLFTWIIFGLLGPANAACLHEITRKLKYSTRHTCMQIVPGGVRTTYTDTYYRSGPIHQLVQGQKNNKAIAFGICANLLLNLSDDDSPKPVPIEIKFDRDSYTSTCSFLLPIK